MAWHTTSLHGWQQSQELLQRTAEVNAAREAAALSQRLMKERLRVARERGYERAVAYAGEVGLG